MLGAINMLGNKTEHTSFGKTALSALTSLDWFPGDQVMSVHSFCAILLSESENGEG